MHCYNCTNTIDEYFLEKCHDESISFKSDNHFVYNDKKFYCSKDCYKLSDDFKNQIASGVGSIWLADKDSLTYKTKRDRKLWQSARKNERSGFYKDR